MKFGSTFKLLLMIRPNIIIIASDISGKSTINTLELKDFRFRLLDRCKYRLTKNFFLIWTFYLVGDHLSPFTHYRYLKKVILNQT